MQQLKHRESRRLCDGIKLLLSNFASSYLHDRSLLMLLWQMSVCCQTEIDVCILLQLQSLW